MVYFYFKIRLLSDATFGRGDGVAGFVDQEVEHDPSGFPYLRGRTLKGLLSEECDNLISVLPDESRRSHWQAIAAQLFGVAGSTLNTIGQVHVGDACLPADLRQAVTHQLQQPNAQLTKQDVLSSLTMIRRQTAINPDGVPENNSLRSMRVITRELEFNALLSFEIGPDEDIQVLLAVGALALRHVGTTRNRGRGHVKCCLCNAEGEDMSQTFIRKFS